MMMQHSRESAPPYLERAHERPALTPGHRFFPDCLRETWARWIEWAMKTAGADAWFVTLTFKTEVSHYRAYAILKAWLHNLKQGYEHKTGSKQLRWICAEELQKREVIHFHLLIFGIGLSGLSRKRWESRWENEDRISGFCRIHDAVRGAAPYLAKYINKGDEISRGGYWRGLVTPGSVTCCQPNSSVKFSDESQGISQAAG